jgi:hypothetical protein
MAILDRPLFQRRPTKDELRGYGLPAFANGGIVYANTGGLQMQSAELKPGGKVPGRKYYNKETGKFEVYQPELKPETAITSVLDNYEDKIIRDQKNPPPVLTGQETITDTPTEEMYDFDIELKEKPTPKKTKDDEPKPVDDTEELKKKYLKESKLLKEILGDNKEMVKRQGFLQLAQFGLNLASAQGSNFLDKVAKSAKDPLNAFAELGRKAFEDERAIELMALEQVRAKEAADLEYERELAKEERQATLAKELQEMKVAGAEDDLLKIYKSAYGEEAGERKFLEYKEAGTGATKTDFVAGIVSDLIATNQYSGDEGLARATKQAQDIGDKIYGPDTDGAVANQGDVKTMSSESDWQNIKVGEQFVLPDGRTGTKTGNALTDYTLG